MAYLAGYDKRRLLTVDYTKVDSDETNFPVMVDLTSFAAWNWDALNDDGFDIRFTQYDGTTELKYEREQHIDNSKGIYWVKIPQIKSTTGQNANKFYIYYRTTDTADGADPTNVWDSNYKAVYHLKDITTSTVDDSTTVNDGTKTAANEPNEVDAQVGKGQDFDGTNDFISAADNDSLSFGDGSNDGSMTVEAWGKADAILGFWILNKGIWSTDAEYTFGVHLSQGFRFCLRDESVHECEIGRTYTGDMSGYQGVWTHFSGTYDGTSASSGIKVFLNGSQVDNANRESNAGSYVAMENLSHALWLGRYSSLYANGMMDEVRLSNTERSAGWLKATYNSGNDSLLTYGSEESFSSSSSSSCSSSSSSSSSFSSSSSSSSSSLSSSSSSSSLSSSSSSSSFSSSSSSSSLSSSSSSSSSSFSSSSSSSSYSSSSSSSSGGVNMRVNIGDSFKEITEIKINIGGTWRNVTGTKININDSWRDVF